MIADAGKGMGSPPRMRGKAERRSKRPQNPGITPAYAGKRDLVISESGDIEDHPRVCGEKRRVRSWRALLLGSPPRMRGKDGVNDSVQAVTGITPACAGKSEKTRSITTTRRDHPRVCGEMSFAVLIVCIALGSPPRMRGKVHLTAYFFIIWGITPACAGKRMVFAGRKSRTWDHPRVCGEKPASMPRHALRRGSPPRMRGKV